MLYNYLDEIFGFIVVIIIIALICREIVTWYYKINIIVTQQAEQTKILRDIFKMLSSQTQNQKTASTEEAPKEIV